MKFEIKNKWTGVILFSMETDSFRTCVEAARAGLGYADLGYVNLSFADLGGAKLTGAKLTGANLKAANLRGADLGGANLKAANLRGVDLRYANLSHAHLKGANLRGANLTDANLTGADLTDTDLGCANLTDANLTGADLRGADLIGADLTGADLTDTDLGGADLGYVNLEAANLGNVREDFLSVLDSSPTEVPGLRKAIVDGRIDGSSYEGDCACLVGTIAKVRGCDYRVIPNLTPDSLRPAERFFLGIHIGDTPETNQVSALALKWLDKWTRARADGR